MSRRRGKDNIVGDKDGVQVIMTDKGDLVNVDILKKYEVKANTSQQIEREDWKPKIIEPPYRLPQLMQWIDLDTIHSSCIRVKMQDAIGIGYYLESDDAETMALKDKDKNYQSLMSFFSLVNPNEDISAMLEKVFMDYEGCGNGYIEVSRDIHDKINALYHVNATTMRWCGDKDKLVQRVGMNYVYFKPFGEEKILNRKTGNYVQSVRQVEDAANEVIVINQYSWKSIYYGIPEWLPAVYAMFGEMKEREYNLDFFLNFGIPAYAVILEGVTLNPDVDEEIKKFFETTLKESNYKTLTLSCPKGGKIHFEPLNIDTKEASFRMYHADNTNTVLAAHRVPPYRVGIVVEGKLGGSVSKDTDRIYLDSVINPRQKKFAWVINELIINRGMDIQGWTFRFEDINIVDEKVNSEIYDRYIKNGIMSPNEIRNGLGLPLYEGGDAVYVASSLIPIGIVGETAEQASARKKNEEEVKDEEEDAAKEEVGEENGKEEEEEAEE